MREASIFAPNFWHRGKKHTLAVRTWLHERMSAHNTVKSPHKCNVFNTYTQKAVDVDEQRFAGIISGTVSAKNTHLYPHTCSRAVVVTTRSIVLTWSCWWAKQHISDMTCLATASLKRGGMMKVIYKSGDLWENEEKKHWFWKLLLKICSLSVELADRMMHHLTTIYNSLAYWSVSNRKPNYLENW